MNEQNKRTSCLGKIFILLFSFCFIACFCLLIILGYAYYKLTQTNDLAIYISKKLSRPNKYTLEIEELKNTFPLITATNVGYKKQSNISSFSVDVNELIIYPDYLNPKIGTHSFQIINGSMYLKKPKFLMNSENIQLFGKYNSNHIYIASSTWQTFGGKIYLSGHIDCTKKPSPYEIDADLVYVRLEDILKGTKNKGLYTGNVYGKLELQSSAPREVNGLARLSITNGTYNKPELVVKINNALHKIGLHSTLKDLAETVASNSFSLNGDFKIINQAYETNNAIIRTPWSFVKFSGTIGPKTALNGTFVIKYKDYSDFTIKVKGKNSKNMDYTISDSDKARLVSIIFREISKGTELRIKKEGKRSNKKFNSSVNEIGKKVKKFFNKF